VLARQRQTLILEHLDRTGGVRVSDLVQMLGVSDMTVRRDLKALQAQGLLDKVHGGATPRPAASTNEPGFQAKSARELAEKDAIGRWAAQLVQPGSAVALSAGTTTHALARHLTHIPDLTIVTNSIPVASVFFEADLDHTVLLIGGLRTVSDALVGPLAVAALAGLHVDLVFMGVHGIDPDAGYTTPNLMEAETNRALLGAAATVIVVADHTKWRTVGLSRIARLEDADILVTDAGIAQDARDILGDRISELVVAGAEPG
jgi:DeoR/GlpR family transcriptional regulator of sugar metabolism